MLGEIALEREGRRARECEAREVAAATRHESRKVAAPLQHGVGVSNGSPEAAMLPAALLRLLARQSSAQFDPLANLIRAGLNQPPARASTSGAWQDPSAPLPTDVCSGGCPAAGARLPSCCLSAMAVFALFRLPVRCELLVCHAIIHEQSTVQFLEVVVAQ